MNLISAELDWTHMALGFMGTDNTPSSIFFEKLTTQVVGHNSFMDNYISNNPTGGGVYVLKLDIMEEHSLLRRILD